MASYDSDSDFEQEYTETSVLLGYASNDPEDDTISRLGGIPEWLNPDKPPSASLARCGACKDLMVLLLQLNGELERFPGHDRRLYVFSCRKQTCRRKQGSVRALRGNRIDKAAAAAAAEAAAKEAEEAQAKKEAEKAKKADGPGLGEALFGTKPLGGPESGANPFATSANPFSTGGNRGVSSNPFATSAATSSPPAAAAAAPSTPAKQAEPARPETTTDAAASLPKTFAETLNLHNTQRPSGPPPPPEPWPESSALPKPYPVSYISDAELEVLDPEPPEIPQNVRMEVDDSSAGDAGAGIDKDTFESSMDAVFQKFADRLAQNPDQVIRYEFGGQPLLYSKDDSVGRVLSAAAGTGRSGMPRCGNCGAGRVFELQLTPQAITELEADELGLDGMDWGTIIVGVCEADCVQRGVEVGEVGYLEEWCGVQWEELATN
ncbi:hypothetical protein SODALDRAFT_278607 [Sodiomyces alkalinus F11]|uniref:Programmed cell death protein 2 C-terminal domain-containing protein n=1 Tax=Sodiomyces alkalinus (strain CBS 110278 / VKM F-3762 / F11) TaxID=1314773 RepID=A0A3N2PTX5_SODAK|nr:hypothetical protein SODALDRAFT_278607 [Sodiomyces alkalinus F11]ROT37952.1 hypothetical protein SODALDRAFT_278607 [Sodiomyces alkalinus F11]